jgi:hypothetical protein
MVSVDARNRPSKAKDEAAKAAAVSASLVELKFPAFARMMRILDPTNSLLP